MELTQEYFDKRISDLTARVDGMATTAYLNEIASKVDGLATKEDVQNGYEELARIVAEGFRGSDERAREHREAMVELQGKVDQLVGTVKELAEMHRESMEAIKELSVGHHNHEVRITHIEQGRRGFHAQVA